MNKSFISSIAVLSCVVGMNAVQAMDVNGRVSVSGSLAHPHSGDLNLTDADWISTDQESVRLMLSGGEGSSEWTFHTKASRQHYQGTFPTASHSSDFFRYKDLASDWVDDVDADSATYIGAEIDRASFKASKGKFAITAGRQPIDWGSGRFWQPLNVFGAFAPTDLDTEYKPGIDAMVGSWFPSAFSSLSAAYVLSPDDDVSDAKNSGVVHYKTLVGEQAELSLLGGEVSGDQVLGFAVEGEKSGVGLRLEAVHHDPEASDDQGWFIVAGADYKFDNEITFAAEFYHHQFGVSKVGELSSAQHGWLLTRGLQPHVSQNVVGVSLQKELTPLLNGSYTLLGSQLSNEGDREYSFLHQLNLEYSLSDESNLLFSLQSGVGKGTDDSDSPQSEFGHTPIGFTARWSRYF